MRSVEIRPGGKASNGTKPRQHTDPVKRGYLVAKQTAPYRRTNAVRADKNICLLYGAIGEISSPFGFVGLGADALHPEPEHAFW